MFDPNYYYYVLASMGFIATAAITLGSFVWWLANQFRDVRNLVFTKFDEVMKSFSDKLEYHERHDDQRFNSISNDLWAIRIRNAARDGTKISTKEID